MSSAARIFLFLLLIVASQSAESQQRTRSDHALKVLRLVKITVAGLERYSEADVIAASGLRVGSEVTSDDLQAASDRLGASGAFASIEYRFIGVPTGVSVVFRVKETVEVVPVVFENFVWFTREEQIRQARAAVPLFREKLPLAGELREQVRQALEQALATRGIAGSVVTYPDAPPGVVARGVVFRVEGPEVVIATVRVDGVQHLNGAELQQVLHNHLAGQPYLYSKLRDFPEKNLHPIYWKRGYLEVAFDEPRVEVTKQEGARTSVAVTFPVREGRQFRYAGVTWTGNQVFPAEELSRKIELQPGQPADAIRLEHDLGEVRKLYGSRGYMGVHIVPRHVLNASGEARFELTVAEGEVYRMGSLEILAPDLDRSVREQMRSTWNIPTGAVYDSSRSRQFMADTRHLLPVQSTWEYTYREEMEDEKKVVNLIILMKPLGSGN